PRGRRFPFGGDGDFFPGAGRAPGKVEVKIDFNRIGRRARRLTRTADAVGSVAVSPDGRAVVFGTTGIEGGRPVQSIWSVQLDGSRLTRLTQSGAGGDGEEGPPRRFF